MTFPVRENYPQAIFCLKGCLGLFAGTVLAYNAKLFRMQLLCLQLKIPFSQLSFFAYSCFGELYFSSTSEPRVCQTYGLHASGLSRKRPKSRNDNDNEENSDSYNQGVEC